jgi:hypothetical protein
MTAFGIFAIEYLHDHVVVDRWLESFDPEAHDCGGQALFTPSPTYAMQFASRGEAIVYLHTIPTTRPLRADGRPNMPLRAFDVEIRRLPDA